MSKTTPTFFFLLITITTYISLVSNSVIAVNPKKGFTLRMIHKDSKESLFYDHAENIHLTTEDRIQKLMQQSKSRVHYIRSQILLHGQNATSSMINPDRVRVPISYDPAMWYVGMVSIGTFSDRDPIVYSLLVDSGSDMTWVQCKGATRIFYQGVPLYPWEDSKTYRPVPCRDHSILCPGDKCNKEGQCTYDAKYSNGGSSSGVIAQEIFTVISSAGGVESVQILMGCGFDQANFVHFGINHFKKKPDLIAGILGLGRGPISFLKQLGGLEQNRFSYCFELYGDSFSNTYLRFGADAIIHGQMRSTPIVENPVHKSFYYLNLLDISVGNKKVGFVESDFAIKENGTGGCIIESGTHYTMMYKDHFFRFAKVVVEYFEQIGMPRDESTSLLCFVRPKGRSFTLPHITFHFTGADYVVSEQTSLFLWTGDNMCLLMGGYDGGVGSPALVLGALQQTNKRILYDNFNMKLWFMDEICKPE